ncbi:MAG TPA: PHB depolymerase family esterase, partial [Bacteroidia bacterium]
MHSQTQVTGFGTNPGNLNMYKYVPAGITGPAPLVIAMHGCTQNAAQYAQQTGWNKLADRHKFYLVYPEQVSINNSGLCFTWFDTTKASRNKGEALSIKQMRDYMVANYNIDTTKIFVTGLSAGACMTVVMMATYPEIFSKGAEMSGVPYRAATSSLTSYNAMNGLVTKTPAQWGALVKGQNPSYTGKFPNLA